MRGTRIPAELWGNKLYTPHGATSYGMEAGDYEFISYHWLYRAYHALCMPAFRNEGVYRRKYIVSYLSCAAKIKNYWEIYMDNLEDRYDDEDERKTIGTSDKAAVEEWKQLRKEKEDEEEEKDDVQIKREKREWRNERTSTIMTWTEDQGKWNEETPKSRRRRKRRRRRPDNLEIERKLITPTKSLVVPQVSRQELR